MARLNKFNREQRRLAQVLQGSMQVLASQQLTVQQMSGPIPDPDNLRRYNEIQPGLADRIVKMAEDEAIHRRGLETISINAQAKDIVSQRLEIRIGQFCAIAFAIVGMVAGVYAITHGAQVAGSLLSGGTLASVVGAFLYRHHKPPAPSAPAQQESDTHE